MRLEHLLSGALLKGNFSCSTSRRNVGIAKGVEKRNLNADLRKRKFASFIDTIKGNEKKCHTPVQ